MSDPLGVGVDGDTAAHVGGGSMLLLTAFGMARSMFNAAKERDAAAKERAEAEVERKVLLTKVDEMVAGLKQLEKAAAQTDRELALMTQMLQQRSVNDDHRDARLDRLEQALAKLEQDRAYQSGIRKASEGA